ncbi:Polysaccharide biosynthesis protein CapD [uncultured Woeseiaceae bacterium]|uniref:Polysaccharide biosynthesis protein CapD n=1 Tax=uncultured Woeseiaceae bacterium TaxID=1983305 RepID=A0A7D9H357_9GAMM|nr:Polysaccharide biosynthesis protein CapD [uncultured Woeseiaceae bacterium]
MSVYTERKDSDLSEIQNNNNLTTSLREILIGLPRPVKQLVAFGTDAIGFTLCAIGVAWLLMGSELVTEQIAWISVITVVAALLLAWSQGLYRSVVRYIGLDLIVAGTKITAGAAVAGGLFVYIADFGGAPLRWAIAFWGMAFIYICSSRYLARLFLVRRKSRIDRERVIIYGAGSAGAQLTITLFGGDQFLPVAMVDDDPTLYHKLVKGLTVHPPANLDALIHDSGATRVLLAMPTASRRTRREVLERLSQFPVHVQTMPEISDLISGQARVDDIREVDVEDLLGREPVPPDPELLSASVSGKRVMVTGAGGSIGSELCRQILKLEPKTLVLFEISEFALYNIESELRGEASRAGCELVALLGSVHHEHRVRETLETFRINTIYHAAAYKHVPVVEHNLLEGIHNNILGTLHAARAAIAAEVDNFVLISTDKAVSPTSVMGATKRFAEMTLQALQDRHNTIRFCMVRFGNVLESSGSVVPLFREQIRRGGPVTVTHRDIIRYFMTITEAAQLVIQAGGMAKGGDVFVLDMGNPVKIQDLATRMINLTGCTVRDEANPDGDIEIEYTGLRPAEKLYEELLIGTDVSGTRHPRIMRAREDYLDYDSLDALVNELKAASRALDRRRARQILLDSVGEYDPSNGIEDLVWVRRRRIADAGDSEKVVDFPSKRA